MEDFVNKQTTINFDGDLKFNREYQKYNKETVFTIIKQTRGGKYYLQDECGQFITLPKRNIQYFKTCNTNTK
jgi:hypothetical protein